jgi:hypothetical protein
MLDSVSKYLLYIYFIFKGLLDTCRAIHTSNVHLCHVDFWKERRGKIEKLIFHSRTNDEREISKLDKRFKGTIT